MKKRYWIYITVIIVITMPYLYAGSGVIRPFINRFIALVDTPSTYTDQAGKVVSVNAGETALEFTSAGVGDLLANGNVPLTANWDVGPYTITGLRFVSDQATGTAPFTVASTTQVANLNVATAGVATKVTITDNESTNENNPIVFVAGGDLDGGNLGLESDGTTHYNPSTGTITATEFVGGGVGLTALNGENISDDTIDNDSIDWADMTDLTTDGAVVWGNIAEGELADSTVVSADIKDDTIDSDDYAPGSIDYEHLSADVISGAAAVGTFESGDTFLVLEAGVGLREADYDDLPGAGGGMTDFILEDADGTEVSISDAKEIKFIESTGIDIDWTDVSDGSDADPFDLTFTIDITAIAGGIAEGELADSTVVSADIKDDTIDSDDYAPGSIDDEHIADDTIQEPALNITNAGDAGVDNYLLSYNHAGTNFTWVAAGSGDMTKAVYDSGDSGGVDLLTTVDSTYAGDYVLLTATAVGTDAPKTDAALTYDASAGILAATGFAGALTGNVTGDVSGTAATVTGAAQANITSLGTLTALTVDDITINGNTISSAGASTLAITPTAGQSITFDGTVTLDAGVITGATSFTSTNITTTTNIKSEPKHLRFTIIDPLTTQTEDNEICLVPAIDAAITVTKIEVTLDAAANEVAGDLKWADAFIGLANATVINVFDTSSGVLSDSSITAGAVASGKCIYISFDSAPDTAIHQMCVDITYDYD